MQVNAGVGKTVRRPTTKTERRTSASPRVTRTALLTGSIVWDMRSITTFTRSLVSKIWRGILISACVSYDVIIIINYLYTVSTK